MKIADDAPTSAPTYMRFERGLNVQPEKRKAGRGTMNLFTTVALQLKKCCCIAQNAVYGKHLKNTSKKV